MTCVRAAPHLVYGLVSLPPPRVAPAAANLPTAAQRRAWRGACAQFPLGVHVRPGKGNESEGRTALKGAFHLAPHVDKVGVLVERRDVPEE